MCISLAVAHDEPDVHQTRSLRDLPVYSSRRNVVGYAARVDHKVAHASEEVVLVDVPLCASSTWDVRIRICPGASITADAGRRHDSVRTNDGHSAEVGCGEQCGRYPRIANDLGVVISSVGRN